MTDFIPDIPTLTPSEERSAQMGVCPKCGQDLKETSYNDSGHELRARMCQTCGHIFILAFKKKEDSSAS